ncbi:NADH oxidase [uncultured Roseburia sp.]|uniref:2,4-dienoyl-CoA reductase n=1 Tax=Brotonthovivens ammoniilytica TaxID=2981725 RepID=A0ABT2TLV1_9FIRM|nr:2,4-dienoyl-CoA reductase [Brotonthovivens ammoniilytica]MCU6762791.1 2,4-dienoyl-CoA reductase [Brotonthovivens ammoniilytica]SCI89057.1 NADH oxidase [uncultured Roseburia sp.]
MAYEKLLEPVKIGPRVAQNRFFVQAMECNSEDASGNPSEETTQRYCDLAAGEAGLITLEAITVTRESRARDNQLTIMPQNEKPLTKFMDRVHEANPKSLIVFQLTHSGELSNPSFSRRVTPNSLPGYGGELLTEEDVERIMDDFVTASKIAYNAGADGIDLKLCHGYFGSQMIRPYNNRDWKYGGSWENRTRFPYELMERIRKEIPDKNFLVGSKISAWEGFPGGFGTEGPDSPIMDLTEPLELIKGLEERGASYIVQSAGSPSITVSLTQADRHVPYFAYLHQYWAKEFKKVLKPETVVIGSNFSPFRSGKNGLCAVTEEDSNLLNYGTWCVENDICDMIGLGRQSFADPFLPKKVREGKTDDINYCLLCDRCLELLIQQSKVGCVVYDKSAHEELVRTRKEKGNLKIHHT